MASKGQWGSYGWRNHSTERRSVQSPRAIPANGDQGRSDHFNDGKSTLNCRVRDMTAGGARLDLSTQQLLPHEFELQVSGSTIRRCGLRWAHGTFVGVHFLPDAAV